jgi:hypothetical protein
LPAAATAKQKRKLKVFKIEQTSLLEHSILSGERQKVCKAADLLFNFTLRDDGEQRVCSAPPTRQK